MYMSFRIPQPHMLISGACQDQMTSYTCNDVNNATVRCGSFPYLRLRHICHHTRKLIHEPLSRLLLWQLQLQKKQAGWWFMEEFPRVLYLKYADGYIEAGPNRNAGPQNRGAFHCNRGRVLRWWYWRRGPLFLLKDNIECSVKLSFATIAYSRIEFSAFYQIRHLEAGSYC